ncbi:MAG: squalene/phytoene synthase family protein [Pseudomonadota bacterium]
MAGPAPGTPSWADPVAACAALVASGDPDRFLATMTAPVEARAVLFPIYAFNLEVARAPWVSPEPIIGEMRLQWWRDALAEIGRGDPPRAHEVAAPLAEVARRTPLPLQALDALVEHHRAVLETTPFSDTDALDAFLAATGGGLMWSAAAALGASEDAAPAIRSLGWAAGLAGWLRAIPELEARGRHPLPDGRPETVAELARLGLARLDEARGPMPVAIRPALRAGWRTRTTLRQAARDPSAVAEGRLGESEFARRASLTFKALTGRW